MKTKLVPIVILFLVFLMCKMSFAQLWLWSSPEELSKKPMSGLPWEKVKLAADRVNPNAATVSNQDSNNNVEILAAAIVYARTGNASYREKVVSACQKLVADGKPGDRTLAWARETGAYALAADLVGYRTPEFETWLRNMAEVYEDGHPETLLAMFKRRPNNWGTQAFGSLCAIYAYLQDSTRLNEVRNYWMQAVVGPKPDELVYGGPENDLSWHVDETNLRLINPKGAVKQGLNIDGIVPDDMRRGGPFQIPPKHTGYAWETLQGMVSGARILERVDMPIWAVADSAIYRAVYALQVRLENELGGWKAEGDDLWMLPFMDKAYENNWSEGQSERMWQHGKNAGWPYVVWDATTVDIEKNGNISSPASYGLSQNYPNPFNLTTTIHYSLAQASHVGLVIYDVRGQLVSKLVDGFENSGNYSYVWEAVDANSRQLATGIYLARLQADSYVKTIKMVIIR